MQREVIIMIKTLSAVMIFLTIFCFVLLYPEYKSVFSPVQDIRDVDESKIEIGMHIRGDLELVYDYCEAKPVRESFLGINTSHVDANTRLYILPIKEASGDGVKLLLYKSESSADDYLLDKIIEEMEAGTSGTTVFPVDAKIVKLTYKIPDVSDKWYGDAEFLPYMLEPMWEMGFLLVFSLIMLVGFVLSIIVLFRKYPIAVARIESVAPYEHVAPVEDDSDDKYDWYNNI